MRVEVPVINVPTRILGIGGTAQVGVQKGPDVRDVRISKGAETIPNSTDGRLRVTYSDVILVLVDLCVRRIEIRVSRRERRQRRALTNDWTGRDVTDKREICIDAQLTRAKIELAPIKNSFVGDHFTDVCESKALPVEREGLTGVAPLRQRKRGRSTYRTIVTVCQIGFVCRFAGQVMDRVHNADERRRAIHHRGSTLQHLNAYTIR